MGLFKKTQLPEKNQKFENFIEIFNIENAIDFIEQSDIPLDENFICELQKKVVAELTAEGDINLGSYRESPVYINGSFHEPPESENVPYLMKKLGEFINCSVLPQYDLIKIALVHHLFVWIHPFNNGNGRTARLMDNHYVQKNILEPTIVFAYQNGVISKEIKDALMIAATKPLLQSSDFAKIGPNTFNRSRNIQKLIKANFFKLAYENSRKYYLDFSTGPLMTGYITQLNHEGFIPNTLMGIVL